MAQSRRYDDDASPVLGAAQDGGIASSHASYARFTLWCAAVVGAGVLLLAAFVGIVDPYRLYRFVDSPWLNRVKPLPEQYREQVKLAQATAERPDVVLLGNSRIEVGLDPDSPQLRAQGRTAYNLGLAGSTLAASGRVYDRLRVDAAVPAMAVVGVEFLDFLVAPDSPPAPPSSPPGAAQSWQWRVDTLFSIRSVSDAIRTVRLQKVDDPETMTAHGQTPLREYNRYARAEGYHAIFQQRAQENARNFVRKPHHLAGANGSSESIDRLRGLLDTMARDRTDVHLVIYPYHAQMMAMFEEAGLQPALEAWKGLLVREADAARTRHPQARISLWDFSGFGAAQCERIPAPGDLRSRTRWYWESGHFKSALGERILQRVLGGDTAFGFRLTTGTLDANRRRIAAERAACAGGYPELFAGAHDLVAAARAQAR